MFKTYAPKGLHGSDLRGLLADLSATPLEISKFLRVTERSVWRWLSDDSAPYAVLAALWHETPQGREVSHLDVGNALVIERGLARSRGDALAAADGLLARVVGIADFGCANDPLYVGPVPNSPHSYTVDLCPISTTLMIKSPLKNLQISLKSPTR